MIKSILFLALLLTYSCTSSDNCDQDFNKSFEVEVGKTYCLNDGSNLEILEITSSYCPCNAVCVWEGETMITAQRISSDEVEPISFHEVLIDQNPSWGSISDVEVTEDCDPEVVSVSIIITN